MIKATFSKENVISHPALDIKNTSQLTKDIIFDRSRISLAEVVAFLSSRDDFVDMTVKDPDIEDIVREIYNSEWCR